MVLPGLGTGSMEGHRLVDDSPTPVRLNPGSLYPELDLIQYVVNAVDSNYASGKPIF